MQDRNDQYQPNRRQFLVHACAAGIGGGIALSATTSEGAGGTTRISHIAQKPWEELVGDTFYACGSPLDEEAQPAVLVLRDVERRRHNNSTELPPGVPDQWCSLIFEVAGPEPVTSATHIVEHTRLGRFPAFINPRPDPRRPTANLCEIGFN